MKSNYSFYSLKIWLTSCLLPPFIILIYISSYDDIFIFIRRLPYYFFFCVVAGIASFIPFLFFQVFNKYLFSKIIDPVSLKIGINLQALFLGLFPIFILLFLEFGIPDFNSFNIDNDIFYFVLLYVVVISSAVWIFKIERDQNILKKKTHNHILDDDFNFEK